VIWHRTVWDTAGTDKIKLNLCSEVNLTIDFPNNRFKINRTKYLYRRLHLYHNYHHQPPTHQGSFGHLSPYKSELAFIVLLPSLMSDIIRDLSLKKFTKNFYLLS